MGTLYKRGRIWYVDVRAKGRRIRKRVGASKRIAELALKDAEVKIAKINKTLYFIISPIMYNFRKFY